MPEKNEGELKKQLKRELMRGIYRKPDSVVIDTVVDEAKKGFPIWNNSDSEAKLTEDVLLDLVKKKDSWFKNYFGDSS